MGAENYLEILDHLSNFPYQYSLNYNSRDLHLGEEGIILIL